MKIFVSAILVVLIGFMGWGIFHGLRESAQMNAALANSSESHVDKVARYRAGADQELRSACTNEVTGLRFIVRAVPDTLSDNFMAWTASASVEYINHLGGVDRTNLTFKAYTIGGRFSWIRQ